MYKSIFSPNVFDLEYLYESEHEIFRIFPKKIHYLSYVWQWQKFTENLPISCLPATCNFEGLSIPHLILLHLELLVRNIFSRWRADLFTL